MATVLNKEEIIKAAQSMSKEERLKLIAEIAALPETSTDAQPDPIEKDRSDFDSEVMSLAHQFIDKHRTLLKRLAE
jgi:hypothetical protein